MSNYNYKTNTRMFPTKLKREYSNMSEEDRELREAFKDVIDKLSDDSFEEPVPFAGLCAPSHFNEPIEDPEIDWKKKAEYWELQYINLLQRVKDAIGVLE